MTKLNESKILIFGGANEEGPLKDLYELSIDSKEFVKVKLDQSETILPMIEMHTAHIYKGTCLLYTSPSPRDRQKSRMPSSA